jgi:acyl dehydratase
MAGPKWTKPVVAFDTQVTRDSIKHFVDGIGDLNPIFRDKNYAKKTKYG